MVMLSTGVQYGRCMISRKEVGSMLWIGIIVFVIGCIAVSAYFSVYRDVDKKANEAPDPEMRKALIEIRNKIDRGHSY